MNILLKLCEFEDIGVNFTYDIIGDGPEKQKIMYLIHDLGLEEVVNLHGWKSPDQVQSILQSSDVFLLSSLEEGVANAALEAMSCGLPVVVTNCGGMAEAVTNGREGFIVPLRDSQAIAVALKKLNDDASLRQKMGGLARAKVIEKFSIEEQIKQWIKLLEVVRSRITSN